MMEKKIAVIGAGSFGTALAALLTDKGHAVTLWGRKSSQIALMKDTKENPHYLPGIKLPEKLALTDDMSCALTGAQLVVFAVPAQSFRAVLQAARPLILPKTPLVNVAKGIEKGSLLTLSQVAREVVPELAYAVLSGPSHAEEVARQLPTTVTAAAASEELALSVQEIFNTDRFRVYTNDDVTGVELGGALKNIIALGAGISDGIGFGDNAKAAIMTRGIAEMRRLGEAMGADAHTFSGLSGIGDLIVTCTSMHSRNRRCGILIGQGVEPAQAISQIGMVVEGISTAEAAYQLACRLGVEMPLTECIYRLVNGQIDALSAVDFLMGRKTKNEWR